jgi:hypothetical protein
LDLYCQTYLVGDNLPDSGWTPASAGVCVAELQITGCFSWFGLGASRKCDPRGKRPGGSGAFSWVQCQSAAAFPGGPRGSGSCGFCYTEAAAGQTCGDDAVCPNGHVCSKLHHCRPVSLNGQPCGGDSPCHPALACVNNVCVPRGLANAPCETDDDCDGSLGLLCHMARKRCGKAIVGTSRNEGNPDGTINTCAPGTIRQSTGACLPVSGVGGPCTLTQADGPQCQLSLVCIAGKCAVPTITECPDVRPGTGFPAGADPWCNFDPGRPVYCPAKGDLPWGCWPAGTACGTITRCAGQSKSCTSATQAFDCAMNKCFDNPCSGDPEFPTYCAATTETKSSCWAPGARCSTVTDCNGKQFACASDHSIPDCATANACVPACEVPTGATACNACAAKKCCASYATCQLDPMCSSKAGTNWTALDACTKTYCTAACAAMPLTPPPR